MPWGLAFPWGLALLATGMVGNMLITDWMARSRGSLGALEAMARARGRRGTATYVRKNEGGRTAGPGQWTKYKGVCGVENIIQIK